MIKVGDDITFKYFQKSLEYHVYSTFLVHKHGSNDAIFKLPIYPLNKVETCESAYGYGVTRTEDFPSYHTDDMEALERLLKVFRDNGIETIINGVKITDSTNISDFPFKVGDRVRSTQQGFSYTGTILKLDFEKEEAYIGRDEGLGNIWCFIEGNRLTTGQISWDNNTYLEHYKVEFTPKKYGASRQVAKAMEILKLIYEVNKMELKDIKPVNLKEAFKQVQEEKASAEIKYAKEVLKTNLDRKDTLLREIKVRTEEIAIIDEALKLFK